MSLAILFQRANAFVKLKYVTQTGTEPPFFTFFCNHPDLVEPSFERYLDQVRVASKALVLRELLLRMKFKKKD